MEKRAWSTTPRPRDPGGLAEASAGVGAVVDFLLDDLASALPWKPARPPRDRASIGARWPLLWSPSPAPSRWPTSLPLDPGAPNWLPWSLPSIYYVRTPINCWAWPRIIPPHLLRRLRRVAHGALIGMPPIRGLGVLGSSLRVQRLTQEMGALERALADQWEQSGQSSQGPSKTEASVAGLREERDGAIHALGTADRELAEDPAATQESRERGNNGGTGGPRRRGSRRPRRGIGGVAPVPAGRHGDRRTDPPGLQAAASRPNGPREGAHLAARLGEESQAFQRKVFGLGAPA